MFGFYNVFWNSDLLYSFNVFMENLFAMVGMSWGFFLILLELTMEMSFLVHIVYFRLEMRKKNPQIPFIQTDI